MFKMVGTLPVKTRLPFGAWVLAGLVTLFSLVTSLTQVSSPMVEATKPVTAHYASMTDLLNLIGALERRGLAIGGRPSTHRRIASGVRASLSLTCEALGRRVLSFLNLSGNQPLSHFEIGFSYLGNVCVPSMLNKLLSFNEIVH